MMNIMVSEDGARWGESREAARAARRKRRRIALVVVVTLLVVGLPFIARFIDGLLDRPFAPPPRLLAQGSAVVILIVGGIVSWRNWRETDEMQRRLAIETWAVIGLANFVLHPLLTLIGTHTHHADLEDNSWWASVAIGMASYFIRRIRS